MGWGSFFKNHAGDILSAGATIYGAVRGNQSQNQADRYQQAAIDQGRREYDDRAPLRRAGQAALLGQRNPYDMQGVGFDEQNPFARARGQRALPTQTLGDWDGGTSVSQNLPVGTRPRTANPFRPEALQSGRLPDAPTGQRPPPTGFTGPTAYPTATNTQRDPVTGLYGPATGGPR